MSEWTDGRTDGRTNGRPDVGCIWTAFCGGFLHCQCRCFLSTPPSSVVTPGGCWCLSDAVFLPLKLLSLQIATSISIASFFVFVKKNPDVWLVYSLSSSEGIPTVLYPHIHTHTLNIHSAFEISDVLTERWCSPGHLITFTHFSVICSLLIYTFDDF